jgi:hypothetical protein
MTAFLARLDGYLISTLNRVLGGETAVTLIIWAAETALDLEVRWEDFTSKMEARRRDQRTPVAKVHVGSHRRVGRAKTWDQDRSARSDYEWGMALKRWAARTEGSYLQWQ